MEHEAKIFENSLPEYTNEEINNLIKDNLLIDVIKELEYLLKNMKTISAEEVIINFEGEPLN